MEEFISKKAASETIKRFRKYLDDKTIFRLRVAIHKIPDADVKPVVKGEWIYKERHEHHPSGKPYTARYCGVCGRRDHNEDSVYCGYCGADMRPVEALKQAAAEAGADGLLPATE